MIQALVTLPLSARDQGARGSCVAFSIAGIQGYFVNQCLSPEYAYLATALLSPNWQPNQGLDVRIAADATAAGLPQEQDVPYQPDEPPQPLPQLPLGLPLHGPRLTLASKEPAEIEAHLSAGHPVGVLLALTRSFMNPVNGIVEFEPAVYPGRHAVIVAGLGIHSSGEPHYLICNSWGTGWGINGHAWISRTYLTHHASCAYGA